MKRALGRAGMTVAAMVAAAALTTGASLATGHPVQVQAATLAGPDLTVVGFGLANASPGSASGYQLNLNFQMSNPDLSRSLGDMEAAVRHAVVKFEAAGLHRTAIQVQPLNINLNNSSGVQVNDSMTVTLASQGQVASVSHLLSAGALVGVNNYYLNSNSGPSTISRPAMEAAYRQAWLNARETAQAMASAQHLALVRVVAEAEGQSASNCGMGGYCPTVGYSGPVGPNQVVEALTVTFATTQVG